MNINNKDLQHIADCIMVDTLGLRVKDVRDAKLPKAFSQVSGDPQVTASTEWSKASVQAASGKLSLRVRGIKKSGELLVEGSNAFHYQGHNIVSSNHVTMSAFSMLHAVKEQFPLGLKLVRPWDFLRGEDIEVTRADTPMMLKIPNGLQKGLIINALALAGIRDGINTSLFPSETVYYDQSSQSSALKAYDKRVEMERKRGKKALPDSPNTAALLDLADTTIRFEAVYRQKYFKNDPDFKQRVVTPAMLTPAVLAGMFAELIEKYNLRGSLRQRLNQDDLWAIRRPYRDTVAHWQNGVDLLKMFDGNDAKLRAHQRLIKKEWSINIFAPTPGEIEVPIELGEILRVENFVPVPAAIHADPALFYERNMHAEWEGIHQRLGLPDSGTSRRYIDPNLPQDDELPAPDVEDQPF